MPPTLLHSVAVPTIFNSTTRNLPFQTIYTAFSITLHGTQGHHIDITNIYVIGHLVFNPYPPVHTMAAVLRSRHHYDTFRARVANHRILKSLQ
jgi:hypothetical protein